MSYEISIELAWNELSQLCGPSAQTQQTQARTGVRACMTPLPFLGEIYDVDLENRSIKKASGERSGLKAGEVAGEMESVLMLHYLIGIVRGSLAPSSEMITFRDISGGDLFWPAFERMAIQPLRDAFEWGPEHLLRVLLDGLDGKKVQGADEAVEISALPGILIRVLLWRGEEGMPAEASLLFDRAITGIYCTEDVAVLLTAVTERALFWLDDPDY